jgi:hypothetical protein
MANNIDYISLSPEFEKYSKETGEDLYLHFAYGNHRNNNSYALEKDDKLY